MKRQCQSFASVLESNYAEKFKNIDWKSIVTEPIFSHTAAVLVELDENRNTVTGVFL